jgi:hypothetical protein
LIRQAFLTGLLAVSLPVLAGGDAKAQTYDPNYPVCLHSYGPTGYIDCRFNSLAQCRPLAAGRSAECEVNPYFNRTAPAPRRSGRQH